MKLRNEEKSHFSQQPATSNQTNCFQVQSKCLQNYSITFLLLSAQVCCDFFDELLPTMAGDDMVLTVPYGSVKKPGYVMVKGMPCKIQEVTMKAKATSKGNNRLYIVGTHYKTGKKYEDTINLSAGTGGMVQGGDSMVLKKGLKRDRNSFCNTCKNYFHWVALQKAISTRW